MIAVMMIPSGRPPFGDGGRSLSTTPVVPLLSQGDGEGAGKCRRSGRCALTRFWSIWFTARPRSGFDGSHDPCAVGAAPSADPLRALVGVDGPGSAPLPETLLFWLEFVGGVGVGVGAGLISPVSVETTDGAGQGSAGDVGGSTGGALAALEMDGLGSAPDGSVGQGEAAGADGAAAIAEPPVAPAGLAVTTARAPRADAPKIKAAAVRR
jgi:hypothetical protein